MRVWRSHPNGQYSLGVRSCGETGGVPVTNDEIKLALRRILEGELRDLETAIKKEDLKRAKSKLDEAVKKIERLRLHM